MDCHHVHHTQKSIHRPWSLSDPIPPWWEGQQDSTAAVSIGIPHHVVSQVITSTVGAFLPTGQARVRTVRDARRCITELTLYEERPNLSSNEIQQIGTLKRLRHLCLAGGQDDEILALLATSCPQTSKKRSRKSDRFDFDDHQYPRTDKWPGDNLDDEETEVAETAGRAVGRKGESLELRHGGNCTHLPELERLIVIDQPGLTAAGLEAIARFRSLTCLNVRGCENITGADLSLIVPLEDLTTITLDAGHVGGDAVVSLGQFPSLTSLSIGTRRIGGPTVDFLDDAFLASAATALRSLKTLSLRAAPKVTADGMASLQASASLSVLYYNINFKTIANYPTFFNAIGSVTTLTELSFTSRNQQGPKASLSPLQNLPLLERLSLSRFAVLDVSAISDLRHLTGLSFMECDAVNAESMRQLTALGRSLKDLHVWKCSNIGEDGLVHCAAFKRLTCLTLFSAATVTPKVLEHLATLPQLTTLRIVSCDHLDEPGLRELRKANALTELDVRGCPRLRGVNVRQVLAPLHLISVQQTP